jgi:hypothetical protein
MDSPMKLEDDCSNCNNHKQGNFNQEPCKSCLDSTIDPWRRERYPNWVLKGSVNKTPSGTYWENPTPCAKDAINPSHYTNGGIETIDFMKAKLTPEEYRGYLRGSALKYLSRLGNKDASKQEASKAQWNINRLVNEL